MENQVIQELTVFAGAGIAGVIIAFIYDMFRLKRRVVRTKASLVHFEDILFWIIAAIIFFLSSYIISSGETRLHYYAGTILGGALYFGVLSTPILFILTTIIKIIAWPFIKIYIIIKPILRVLLIRYKKVAAIINNRLVLEKYRVKVDFHRLRNTITKK